jgi:glycosyltransferase involved in cell wall biosynthesis
MRLGVVIEETWDFFHEVYADLTAHHQTTLYKRPQTLKLPMFSTRVNRRLFHRDLSRFLASNDVVFFEWASELLAMVSHMPKVCGLVTRLHRYEMYQWASRINWNAVDRVILVSQAKYREFSALYPDHAHKAIVIPEAVSLERFKLAPKRFAGDIGILCHLKPRKRVYELILMFSELIQERPSFRLHIAGGQAPGDGDYYDALQQLVDRLGLRDKVKFYGHLTKPEEWYPLIDVYVSNGFSEGLQVSPMEAMSSGCYCVSHQWDGADELMPVENLFYTNTELKNLLIQYADLSEAEKQATRMRLRGMICERFNVDVTKQQIRRVIEETAAGRAA